MSDVSQLLDKDFWEGRPLFAYVRAYARACRVAPTALLDTVLTRLSALIPPTVTAPAFVGSSPITLNLFLALWGASGAGKGSTISTAESLIPNLRGAVETQPASGEGLVAIFAGRRFRENPEDPKAHDSELFCANPRALLNIPEIRSLGGAASRQGSTIVPTLTSAFSGETLGAWNKNDSDRLMAPRYGYSLALVTGVQPANADILTNESGTGLPQRFLWANTGDPQAPDQRPDRPEGSLPVSLGLIPYDPDRDDLDFLYQQRDRSNMLNPDERYPLTILDYPDAVWKEVDAQRLDALRGVGIDPLDTHKLLVSVKVAGILAMADGREQVDMDDWLAAKAITSDSIETRRRCLELGREAQRTRIADSMQIKDEASESLECRKEQTVRNAILRSLGEDDAREGIKGYVLRQRCGRNGTLCYRVLEGLYEDGLVEHVGETTGRTSNDLWTLPVCSH
ncbi:hypothetical protein [Bifidobacterium polysaccharolyticum]|uniref:hypothetical protein n=1 Tax=Bifidobacterium polysaccharolyticum TaxID=2750967 RepID=UPI0018DC6C07|nr:hypothetical protein [Bifidobacterium polysaccharolyticum]MBI0064544.1 hypothetical protein [Bifidobacterium polysaccharolyticum]